MTGLVERLLPGLAAYPDVHPMLVHFPVALFPVALLFALLSSWRYPRMLGAARLLLLLGVLSMVLAIATGLRAQELMPHDGGSLVSVHRTTMLLGGGLALLLLVLAFRQREDSSRSSRAVFLAGLLILNGIVALGADRGALVALQFRSGLAVPLPEVAAVPAAIEGKPGLGDPTSGRTLYDRLSCDTCHGPDRALETAGIPPALEDAGGKLQPAWITAYLLAPHRIRWADVDRRPLQRMPDFQLAPAEAADLAAYLATREGDDIFPLAPVASPPLTEQEAAEGRRLIGQYACRGCHSIGGAGAAFGPSLDRVGERLRPAYLYAFLKDPKGIVPGTPMKNFDLWDEELRSLTAYLSGLRGKGIGAGEAERSGEPAP